MISALAFVLPQDIFRAFDLLCVQFGGVGTNEQIILDYFERTYVGAVVAGVRAPPIFDHSLWDVYDRVMNNLPRTTNGVEWWHNAFNRNVGLSHANVWRFFTCLLYEHVTMHLRITQDSAGVPADPPSRTYNVLNQQIQTIVRDYANRNTVHYLRYLAYLI